MFCLDKSIVDFVRQEEVDPVYYDRSYYLSPGEAGEKAYQLLQQAMREAAMIAIARVAIRSRQALSVLRAYDDAMLMETMVRHGATGYDTISKQSSTLDGGSMK